jgi:hypothetical protein
MQLCPIPRIDARSRQGRAMPRFYFDTTFDNVTEPDREGVELRDARTARKEAVRAAAEMAKDAAGKSAEQDISIQVRDEAGERIGTARVTLRIDA